DAWPFIGASVAMHMAYYGLLAGAYRHGDLALTYPLMRGVAPLLTTLLGATLLGEWPGSLAVVGIALICAGVIALAARSSSRTPSRRATAMALANAGVIAAYTLIDGAGARRSGDALGYAAWIFAANAVPCTAWICATRGRAFWRHVASHPARAAGGGALSGVAYAICIWAMTIAPISLVAALRETSVLFAAVIGSRLLRERLTWLHWAGVAAVVAGIAATRLG
ncbi:MAG: EamA family transporter, partial [Planctomycetota bacterium]